MMKRGSQFKVAIEMVNEFLAPNRFAKSSNQEKDLVAGEISYKAISPLPWVQSLF